MGRKGVIGLVITVVVGVSAPSLAQWLKYPTDGIPRKADGKPDLTARAPRLACNRTRLRAACIET